MKMKLRFRGSHEHADSERSCTSDLKHALLSTSMMLRMRMLPVLLPVATCRRCPERDRATAKLLVNQPGGRKRGVNYEVSCDWRFQPPQNLAKARGSSAEANLRGKSDVMEPRCTALHRRYVWLHGCIVFVSSQTHGAVLSGCRSSCRVAILNVLPFVGIKTVLAAT